MVFPPECVCEIPVIMIIRCVWLEPNPLENTVTFPNFCLPAVHWTWKHHDLFVRHIPVSNPPRLPPGASLAVDLCLLLHLRPDAGVSGRAALSASTHGAVGFQETQCMSLSSLCTFLLWTRRVRILCNYLTTMCAVDQLFFWWLSASPWSLDGFMVR